MSESKRILELYRSIYEGDERGEAWHGMSLKPLLADVTPEQASYQPPGGGHSILQLVLHMAYWEEISARRLKSEVVNAPLNTPQDWPQNSKATETEWRAAVARQEDSHKALKDAIAGLSDEDWSRQVAGKNYDNYALVHGTLDHCVYHTAQVALIKKAQKA